MAAFLSHDGSLGNQLGNRYGDLQVGGHARVVQGNVYFASPKEREYQCLQTFKTSTYAKFKDVNDAPASGSCRWVLDHSRFQAFNNSQGDDLLWVSADPGCGKSVLARALVDTYLHSSSTCYFFFKDTSSRDATQNRLDAALCALIHQLCKQQRLLLEQVMPSWLENGSAITHETGELWKVFLRVSRTAESPVYCILDALDECLDEDRQELIEMLCQFYSSSTQSDGQPVKIIVTSRPYDNVQRWFEKWLKHPPLIRLQGERENSRINVEINRVIRRQVSGIAEEYSLNENAETKLVDYLESKRNRTYLWFKLALDDIRMRMSLSSDPNRLQISSLQIPETVEGQYDRLLNQVNQHPEHIRRVRQILSIIVGARRPLKIGEMAAALEKVSGEHFSVKHLEQRIAQWCGLFVFLTKNKDLFLIHQTAKEFLTSSTSTIHDRASLWKGSLHMLEVERVMARISIDHICSQARSCKVWMPPPSPEKGSFAEINLFDPSTTCEMWSKWWHWYSNWTVDDSFTAYCLEFWHSHATDTVIEDDQSLLNKVLGMYRSSNSRFQWWFFRSRGTARMRPRRNDYKSRDLEKGVPDIWVIIPEHVMARNGHLAAMKSLSAKRALNMNLYDGSGATMLARAVEYNHSHVLDWLIKCGVHVNITESFGCPEIYLAKSDAIKKQLLEAGARYTTDFFSWEENELLYASSNGRLDVVITIIQKKYPKHLWDSVARAATLSGRVNIVRTLIEVGGDGEYALGIASRLGQQEIVAVLLKHGIDPNVSFSSTYFWNWTALQSAAHFGHVGIVTNLLGAGAKVDTQSCDAKTALSLAAAEGHLESVRVLLKGGADPNGREYNNCPMRAAIREGHTEVVLVLLQFGSSLSDRLVDGTALLHDAIAQREKKIVSILLRNGACFRFQENGRRNRFTYANDNQFMQATDYLTHRSIDEAVAFERFLKYFTSIDSGGDIFESWPLMYRVLWRRFI